MHQNRLQYLMGQYGANEATPEERAELQAFLLTEQGEQAFEEAGMSLIATNKEDAPSIDPRAYQTLLHKILSVDTQPGTTPVVTIKHYHWRRWTAIAAVILCLATGTWLYLNKSDIRHQPISKSGLPGHDGAILTLADGRQVILDSAGNGIIATENGATLTLRDNQLQYNKSAISDQQISDNLLTTPKGRQFQLVLPDGTKVWLNAASSIRFPTAFNGRSRNVTITGEAYLEVAKQKSMPFLVNINNQATIEVLGTSFNINAYQNEANIKATLIDGSIRITNQRSAISQSANLVPGQQAQLTAGQLNVTKEADLSKVMAWKNGLFNFDGASLQEVMKQVERWYDIEVVYEEAVPSIQFFGKMGKDITLPQLLEALKSSEIHFTIEGKKLIIRK